MAGMQVWNIADFVAVQSTRHIDRINHYGIFTRDQQHRLAANGLREFWVDSQ